MPTYDYRCERTGEMFELWQSFSDDAIETCPETHDGDSATCGAPVKKVFSKVGISFKGDGFYKNDHRSSSSSRESDAPSSGGDSSGTSSDKSSPDKSSSSDKSSSDSSSSSSTASDAGGSSKSGSAD